MRKKLKGFTLVELLAAMAIIAVLIGLAGFGISIALKNSRDTQRKAKLNDIQLAINEYYTSTNAYPTTISGGTSATELSLMVGAGSVGTKIPVKGATKAAATTTTSGTEYRYAIGTGGYLLCVKLEGSSTYFDLSTSTDTCGSLTTAIGNNL